MMPRVTGPEFCREFRKMSGENYVYFILLTSKSEKEDIAKGLDSGADDFLTKPVNAAELRARISAGDRILRSERALKEKNHLLASTLTELQGLYQALENDLLEAKKLQQSLVNETYRDLGCAEASFLLRSSGHVGGDLVGMFPVSSTRVGLYAIDVSGHGVSSALMTARLAGYLSATAPDQNVALRKSADGSYVPRAPAETVSILNELIIGEIDTEHYFTLLLSDVDLETGIVTMTQAGHPCPLLQTADGCLRMVGDGGLPVGLVDGAVYEQFEVKLHSGDRLLIYSDGISECADQSGKMLGESGLEGIMQGLGDITGEACLEKLVRRLVGFSGTDEMADDVSAILLDFKACSEPG